MAIATIWPPTSLYLSRRAVTPGWTTLTHFLAWTMFWSTPWSPSSMWVVSKSKISSSRAQLFFHFFLQAGQSKLRLNPPTLQTAAFLGFWFAMSYLPQRTSGRRKRSQGKPSQGQPFFLGGRELPKLPDIGMESSDHWSEILTQS